MDRMDVFMDPKYPVRQVLRGVQTIGTSTKFIISN